MRFFDTHTHVNFSAFKNDAHEAIGRALSNDTWLINVGTQQDTSKVAVDLAQKYPKGIYAAIGLHPVHTYQQMVDEEESHFKSREESFDENFYASLLYRNVVGIGECGLDYFRIPEEDRESAIQKQKKTFVAQIEFAKKHGLPLIVHCRDAYDDVLEILKGEYAGFPGVIHSFTGDWETAKKFVDFGFYVAFNGILTFDKTGRLAEVVEKIPLQRILTETDAPYLTPPPHRGKRNEPLYVQFVVAKIAEIKNMNLEEIGEQTYNNARELFKV